MHIKKIAWIIFVLLLGAGIFWWTSIKKKIVKQVVADAIQKKTDSLYRISYDTSEIDEINGNAYLYNVHVKLDSAQWLQLVKKDSMPGITLELTIAKLTIKGLAQLNLLNNRSLDVSDIIIEQPVLRLDKWKRKEKPAHELNDTMEIYQRLVGKFDFLKARNIRVVDGDFRFLNRLRKDSISVRGINVTIDNFLVDSLHNYQNILSYFVKQARVTASSFAANEIKSGRIEYDSKLQMIRLENLSGAAINGNAFTARSIKVSGLSSESFIYEGKIKAKKIIAISPDVIIKPRKKKTAIATLPSVIAAIDSLVIEKGNFKVVNSKGTSFLIRDVDLLMKDINAVNGHASVEEYISSGMGSFSVGSVTLPMGFHNVTMQKLIGRGKDDKIKIAAIQVKPAITRQQLKTRIGKQADMYNLVLRDITIDKLDIPKLVKDNTLSIGSITMQMNMHVFNDKTIPMDSAKKASGEFPYEKLKRSLLKINIRSVHIVNSTIAYEEQAPKSELNGTIFFTGVNGVATNITNIPTALEQDAAMRVTASARIMGAAQLHSQWDLPFNNTDGAFRVAGQVDPFDITVLNPVFEPLSMSTIRSGYAEQLVFEINGNHQGSTGTELFNYRDLKIDLLKKNKDDTLSKKGFASFLANALIKNNHHSPKEKTYSFKKDRYKSMFNLLWNSILAGAKNTML